MDYYEVFREIKTEILNKKSNDTSLLTNTIKSYFSKKFSEYYVAGVNEKKEYLYDISVLTCSPLEIFNNDKCEYKVHLVVESELGGEGASSSNGVEKNVIEDFFKVIQALSDYKIFIGAYSKSGSENTDEEALKNRIKKMEIINNKSLNKTNIPVILINGDHVSGNSGQIKIVNPLAINGFILKPRMNYEEIEE